MQSRSMDRVTLLNVTIFVEAFLLLSATFWSHVSAVPLLPALTPVPNSFLLGAGGGLAIALCSFGMLWLGKTFGWFTTLREITFEQIAPLFAELKFMDVVIVAALSGFCEEILFRGVMQSQFGLWSTSLIFGLFHCPSLRFISYGLWVAAAGLALGGLYLYTGNLWAPIMAHALSNGISLWFLRYSSKTAAPPAPPES